MNKSLKNIASTCGIERRMTFHVARHTWATIASVDCNISDGDIGISLNHVGDGDDRDKSKSMKVTRGYIGRTCEKIDKSHRQVLDFINDIMSKTSDRS